MSEKYSYFPRLDPLCRRAPPPASREPPPGGSQGCDTAKNKHTDKHQFEGQSGRRFGGLPLSCLSLTRPTAMHRAPRRPKRQGLGGPLVSFSNPPHGDAPKLSEAQAAGRIGAVRQFWRHPDAYERGTLKPCKGDIRQPRGDRPARNTPRREGGITLPHPPP